jgi:predicted nucleotidyltransferase
MEHRTDRLTRPEIDGMIERATRLLIEAAHPEQIILFGSYARGDFTVDSDLDFLVILREVKDRFSEMVRLQRALLPLHFPADVMVHSAHDVEEQGHLPGTALRWALEEGKVLYAAS